MTDSHAADPFDFIREELRLQREASRADRAEARADFAGFRVDFETLRVDFEKVRAEMRVDMADMRAHMAIFETRLIERVEATNGDVKELRGAVDGLKTSTAALQWMVGVLLAGAALWVAAEQWKAPGSATTAVAAPPAVTINNILPSGPASSGPR